MFPAVNFATIAERLNEHGRFHDGELVLGEALLEYLFAPRSRAWFLACRAFAHGGPGLGADPVLHEFVGLLPPSLRQMAMLHVWCAERLRADARPATLWKEEIQQKAAEVGEPAGLIRDLLAEMRDAVEPRSVGPHVCGTQRPFLRKQPMTALLVEREAHPHSVKLVGVVATLILDLVLEGNGEFYPSPELAFVQRDQYFRQAEANAMEVLKGRDLWSKSFDVRWHLTRWDDEHLGLGLAGASLGGCFALGLLKLVAEDHPELGHIARLPVAGSAITAAINPDGAFVPVEASAIKFDAATQCRNFAQIYTVIVAADQSVESLGLAQHAGHPQVFCAPHVDFHVLAAKNVDDALALLADDLSARWRGIDCELPPRNPDFVGRERLFGALRQFIQNHESGYLVLVADIGKGKSSVMVEFLHRLLDAGDSPVYHIVSSRSSLTSDPDRIAACFYDRLRHKHRIAEPPSWAGLSHQQRLERVLGLVSQKVLAEGRKEILFLEAADQLELPYGSALIPAFLCQLPPGVLCVASVRSNGRTLLSGKGVTVWEMDHYVDDEADIRLFLEQQAATVEPPLSPAFITAILQSQVKPVFFTVAACIQELRNPATSAERRAELLSGPAEWVRSPVELIAREWERRLQEAMAEGISEGDFWTTLCLPAVACEPLSTTTLLGLGFLPHPHRERVLALCGNLFQAPSGPPQPCRTYSFPHAGYVRELLARIGTEYAHHCHELMANGCHTAWKSPDNPARRYALEHRLTHLREGHCWKELALVLTDLKFLEQALEPPPASSSATAHAPSAPALSVFDLIAHFHYALPTLKEKEPEHATAVESLARVVIRHAHALKREPRLLAQVAYNELFASWSDATRLGAQIREAAARCPVPWLKRLNTPSEPASPSLVSQFWGHEGAVTAVAFSRTLDLLASGSRDGTVRIWDARTGKCHFILCNPASGADRHPWVTALAFLPDSSGVVSATRDGAISVWKLNANPPSRRTFRVEEGDVLSMAISPDGSMVATGSSNCKVSLWLLPTGSLVRKFEGHRAAVKALAFSPNGQELASGADDCAINIWRLTRPGHVTVHQDTWVHALAYSPDGRTLVSGGGLDRGLLRFWNPENGECLRILHGHTGGVRSLDYSPDGRRIASGSFDRTVLVRDPGTGLSLPPLGLNSPINAVAFSPDGLFLATGSDDRVVRIWDARGLPNVCLSDSAPRGPAEFSGSVLYTAVFSFDGQLAIVGGRHQQARAWATADGRRLAAFEGHQHDVTAVAISRDGRRVASGSQREVRVWSNEMARLHTVLQGHEGYVLAVAFSPDGQRLLTGAEDRKLMLWDADTGRWKMTLSGHADKIRVVAFSPDGRLIASGAEEPVARIWDAESGLLLHSLKDHGGHVRTLAFFENVPWLATGAADETIRLWDLRTGQLLKTIPSPGSEISALAISPDGRLIASGCVESTVRVWDTDTGALVASMNCVDEILALAFDAGSPPDSDSRFRRILRVADAGGGTHVPNFFVMELISPA
jgi:WD40 repeat protein